MPGWRATVGGVLAAGAVFSLVSCSSGDSGDGPEPLAALVGEDGKFDCRRMYTHVPLQAYLSADLSPVDTRMVMSGSQSAASAPDQITCPARYTGEESGGGIALFYVRTMPETRRPLTWVSGPDPYGDWATGILTLGQGQDASDVAAAVLDSPERGILVVFTPVDTDTEAPFMSLGDAAPDAVRTVIDGLEQEAAVPVPEEADIAAGTSLFATDGRFDCSKVFRRLSLATAATAYIGLPVTSATNPVVRETGDHRSCALATGVPEEETSIFPGPTGNLSTELTTGPKDAVRGTPFTGSPDLVGWEEYWNFDGADDPVDATFEGRQSYNARYCRSDSDCITVTAYTGSGEEGGGSPQARKDAALPLVRLVAEREGLLTDGVQQ